MPAEYVAIITDGNGRWAKQRSLPVIEGHRAGADTVKERLRDAVELGVKELTVYSFSTENWTRPRDDPGRRSGLSGGRGGGVREASLRARDARPRPADPDQRRAADLQLPALAVRLLGVRLSRRALARLQPGGLRGIPGHLRGAPAALRGEGVMVEDLDPPSFDFPREREERAREREREPGFLPDPDDLLDFDEPSEVEVEVEVEPDAAPERRSRLQRFIPDMSETTSRVVVAIPWIVFAVAIVGIGGDVFTLALVGLAVLRLPGVFPLCASIHPIVLPGYAAVAGMVLAAHFGDSFQILLVFAALFPVAFVFAAVRRSHALITTSIAFTVLGVAWMGLGFSHAVLLRDLPTHGAALLIDVLVATFLSDTAAYGAGRLFGTRRITPRISPNKTLEGLVGGFIGPNGGLIDRLDAVLFTVVAGYYLSVAFVY